MTGQSLPRSTPSALDAQLSRLVTLAESFGLLSKPREWVKWSDDERNRWAAWEALKLRERSAEPHVAALFGAGGNLDALQAPSVGDSGKPRFVRTTDLVRTTLALAERLPPDVAGVAAIPRSGMMPAAQLAMHLHLPLYTLWHGELRDVGHGYRLQSATRRKGPVLVVDDTVHNGGTIGRVRALCAAKGDRFTAASHRRRQRADLLWAAIYSEPRGMHLLDFYGAELRTPHLLEWNLFSCPWAPHIATDLDGILCPDFTPEEDDDGAAYLHAMTTRRPKYLYRFCEVPAIITARLERYRPETEAWLRKWGVRWRKLVMGPWATKQERALHCMGSWKADRLNECRAESRDCPIELFVESCPIQAAIIAPKTECLVLSPDAGGVL